MRNLLAANFRRLWKSKLFWLLEISSVLFSTIAYVLVGINVKNLGSHWILKNANFYFFLVGLYVGILAAIFSTLFFGTEYSDGTLRNKLSIGHSRKDIYFSNLLLNTVVAILFIMTHYMAAIVVGIPLGGTEVVTVIEQMGLKILYSMVIALVYASVFTLITLLNSNKASCAILNILIALFLLIAGFFLFSALEQPELKYQMIHQADGSYRMDESIPNPRYVGGNLRMGYTILEWVMPAAFALRITSGGFTVCHSVGCILLSILLTAAGITLFQKKDIR